MEIINKYKVWREVLDFLKAINPNNEMNSVEERKLNAMYEVLHNVRKKVEKSIQEDWRFEGIKIIYYESKP